MRFIVSEEKKKWLIQYNDTDIEKEKQKPPKKEERESKPKPWQTIKWVNSPFVFSRPLWCYLPYGEQRLFSLPFNSLLYLGRSWDELGHMPGGLLRKQSRAIWNLRVQYGERNGSFGYVSILVHTTENYWPGSFHFFFFLFFFLTVFSRVENELHFILISFFTVNISMCSII